MRAKIERKTKEAEQRFEPIKLRSSFRSSPAIMAFVDHIFALAANFEGLSAENLKTQHEALKLDLPGLVEIWPEVLPDPKAEPSDWKMPVDQLDLRDPPVIVAKRIAKTIASWIAPGSPESVEDKESGGRRPIRPGDVMILVRNRNSFFDAIIRALKEASVPVAGADRLKLTQHIAVMDLIAAGRTALLPEDDLTLACVLKSPLIGLTDKDLLMMRLPHQRSTPINRHSNELNIGANGPSKIRRSFSMRVCSGLNAVVTICWRGLGLKLAMQWMNFYASRLIMICAKHLLLLLFLPKWMALIYRSNATWKQGQMRCV